MGNFSERCAGAATAVLPRSRGLESELKVKPTLLRYSKSH